MGRQNNFDALRLFAAMVVVLAHMESLSGRPDSFALGSEPMGISGVLIFFAISGYLVTGSWRADPDLGRFLAKRFLRLVPALAVAVPLTYLVVMAAGIEGFPGNRFSTLNGSLWTITIEVQCYIFLALTMLVTTRFGPTMFAAVAAAGVVALSGSYLTLFALAFSVGALLKEYPRLMRWSWAVSGFGLAIYPEHPPVALALIIAPLSIWVGTRSWPVLRNTGRFGDISYGTYIYAYPVQQSVIYFMGNDTPLTILLLVSLSVILPIAWISWRYIERPAMHKKHAITHGSLPIKQDY